MITTDWQALAVSVLLHYCIALLCFFIHTSSGNSFGCLVFTCDSAQSTQNKCCHDNHRLAGSGCFLAAPLYYCIALLCFFKPVKGPSLPQQPAFCQCLTFCDSTRSQHAYLQLIHYNGCELV